MTVPDDAPLIVTAQLDGDSFAVLDALRRRHFPAALNKVPAHISLFHKLPGAEVDSVRATLVEVCRPLAPFVLEPTEWRSLGRGVALAYAGRELDALRGILAKRWLAWLSAQDREAFRCHVTIQNKVEPASARGLLLRLQEGTEPPTCIVEGLALWRYRGGPWDRVAVVRFGCEY